MMFNCIDKIYKDSSSDHDKTYATGLYISLIENHLGLIDNFIQTIVFRCLQQINQDSKELRVINIEVIASAIWYNPRLTLSLLNETQLQFFFSTWFDLIPSFKSEFDKQVMLYGLSSIYTLNYSEMPSLLQQQSVGLLKQMIILTSQILHLREKAGEESEEEAEEDIQLNPQGIDNYLNKNKDEEEEEEEEDPDYETPMINTNIYSSPLDENDEILYFEQVFQNLAATQIQFYNQLIQGLDQMELQILQANFATARTQFELEIKEKQEEGLKKQLQQQVINQ
eukprot:TRINITY_DN16157_c0_g1_i2.p1 TRINITY_DN16157_c0_g1~~TRINITY_DN16157_c0_g1_i2.p1  ORF type:complete len:282 (-),score=55.89 TRINITY_DN16157_c0_g1_i2:209-1054(-)